MGGGHPTYTKLLTLELLLTKLLGGSYSQQCKKKAIWRGKCGLLGGHSIAPKITSANAASASPQPPNEKSRKRQSSYRLR